MKFINIMTALYSEPWLILPAVHEKLCRIVEAHITGDAHRLNGIAGMMDDKEEEDCMTMNGQLAVIAVHGVLGKHVGEMAKSSGTTDISDIEDALSRAMADPNVKGIFLDINSPGGTTTGIPELAAKIAQASIAKSVLAYSDSLMASAAYWLASGADVIMASQSAQIGSIGVYMAWLDDSRAKEMQGYRAELIKRGKFKGMGVSGTSLSDESRAMLQQSVDQVYGWFTDHVKMFREDIPADAMEGQTFFAEHAKENDLIDAVATREKAMAELKDMTE